mmetsp:Transcript_8827/g.19440  ORF Transcript_8827/g.19440 Transcript_8827/m.19440 type:complete len:164 (+) Transcript_8827:86-577(+)
MESGIDFHNLKKERKIDEEELTKSAEDLPSPSSPSVPAETVWLSSPTQGSDIEMIGRGDEIYPIYLYINQSRGSLPRKDIEDELGTNLSEVKVHDGKFCKVFHPIIHVSTFQQLLIVNPCLWKRKSSKKWIMKQVITKVKLMFHLIYCLSYLIINQLMKRVLI